MAHLWPLPGLRRLLARARAVHLTAAGLSGSTKRDARDRALAELGLWAAAALIAIAAAVMTQLFPVGGGSPVRVAAALAVVAVFFSALWKVGCAGADFAFAARYRRAALAAADRYRVRLARFPFVGHTHAFGFWVTLTAWPPSGWSREDMQTELTFEIGVPVLLEDPAEL